MLLISFFFIKFWIERKKNNLNWSEIKKKGYPGIIGQKKKKKRKKNVSMEENECVDWNEV